MTDLKLIDELLCDIKSACDYHNWADVERHSSMTYRAMTRLRLAWESGEMDIITLGLANYFRETDSRARTKSL